MTGPAAARPGSLLICASISPATIATKQSTSPWLSTPASFISATARSRTSAARVYDSARRCETWNRAVGRATRTGPMSSSAKATNARQVRLQRGPGITMAACAWRVDRAVADCRRRTSRRRARASSRSTRRATAGASRLHVRACATRHQRSRVHERGSTRPRRSMRLSPVVAARPCRCFLSPIGRLPISDRKSRARSAPAPPRPNALVAESELIEAIQAGISDASPRFGRLFHCCAANTRKTNPIPPRNQSTPVAVSLPGLLTAPITTTTSALETRRSLGEPRRQSGSRPTNAGESGDRRVAGNVPPTFDADAFANAATRRAFAWSSCTVEPCD